MQRTSEVSTNCAKDITHLLIGGAGRGCKQHVGNSSLIPRHFGKRVTPKEANVHTSNCTLFSRKENQAVCFKQFLVDIILSRLTVILNYAETDIYTDPSIRVYFVIKYEQFTTVLVITLCHLPRVLTMSQVLSSVSSFLSSTYTTNETGSLP